MLAPSDQILGDRFTKWLLNAGTGATSRTLIVKDEEAYEALKANTNYLPNNWKKGYEGTTVKDASNNPIE